ncbi:MAG TPA: phosphotransferase [Streptosporangiaceae bacterium]|jgi:Ser/Thr protein kinase RdoA (MazF antagonist)|nr:phosphotransferase [Streptosporangiaceae bacterium]
MPRIGPMIRDVYRRPGTEELPAHLERQYGIEITEVSRLDAGVFRVDRRGGPPWVARVHVLGRPAERARDDAGVLRFLAEQDFPAERCAHPEPVSEMGGRAVMVTEFAEGGSWANTPASHRRLGALLGRMHGLQAPDGPDDPAGAVQRAVRRPAGSLHHLPPFEGAPRQDLAAAAAMLADLEGRVPPEHAATYEALLTLLDRGDDCRGLPEAFIHPDPAPVNVISAAAGPVLVDWTGAGTGPRLASLAVLLHSAGPRHAAEVLRGYGEHQELTAGELDRVEGALWIRPLWLAAWQCWLAAVSARVNRAHVPDASRIAALAASVQAAIAAYQSAARSSRARD